MAVQGKPAPASRGRLAAIAAAAMLALLGLAAPAQGAGTPAMSSDSWFVLESGRQGKQLWTVKAKKLGASPRASSCLAIAAKWQLSPYAFHRSSYRQCEHMGGRSAANAPPLIASGVFPAHGAGQRLTAVGMIFASGVRRARVTLSDGSTTVIPARTLESEEARKSGLSEFRYAAFSVRGPWCAVRLSSQGASGRTLWSGSIDTSC